MAFSYSPSALAGNSTRRKSGTLKPASQVEPREQKPITFAVDGKQFALIQDRDKNGMLNRQLLVSKSSYQIAIDRDGDGRMEEWELHRADMKVRMRAPYKGHFNFMDIEKSTRVGILDMTFYRTKAGDYAFYKAQMKPRKYSLSNGGYDDFVVGCRASEKGLQELAANVNKALLKQNDANYFSTISQNEIMDSSCKTTPFDPQVIGAAMSRVAGSDQHWLDVSASKPTSKGTFLNCLRYYELDTHASRIEAAMGQYIADADQADPFLWKVKCDSKMTDAGEYFNNGNPLPPEIHLGSLASQQKVYAGRNMDPTSMYAETFFHEMLHYSLIQSDGDVEPIERCCSQEGNESGPDCTKVANLVRIQKLAQSSENQAIEKVKNAGIDPATLNTNLTEVFGSGVSQNTDAFFRSAAQYYASAQDGKDAQGNSCKTSDGKLAASCRAAYDANLQNLINTKFGSGNSICISNAQHSTSTPLSAADATKYCGALRDVANNMVGLDPADGSVCLSKPRANLDGAIKYFAGFFFGQLVNMAEGLDNTDVIAGQFCKIAAQPKSDLGDPDYTPADGQPSQSSPSTSGLGSTSSEVGSSAPASTSPSQPTTGYKGSGATGPATPTYSSNSTERSQQIYSDLSRQNDLSKKVAQIADRIVKPFLPEAQAAGSSVVGVASQDLSSNPTVAEGVRKLTSSPIRLPDLSVPQFGAMPSPSSSAPPVMMAAARIPNASPGLSSALPRGSVGASDSGGRPRAAGFQGGSGGSGGTGTAAASRNVASVPKPAMTPAPEQKAAQERALKSLLAFLQRPYKDVRTQLDRPTVVESMVRYSVQVVDHEGRVFGSGFPQHRGVYNPDLDRLVFAKRKSQQ